MPELAATAASSFDHPVRGRFNAWFFAAFDRYIGRVTAPLKDIAFGDIAPGDILELGPGVGANLSRLPARAHLIAVEPNTRMHPALIRRSAAAGIDLQLIADGAERLPLADASVDDILCSLVLCTVTDPDAVLREVVRVLRPGGRFRFVEHVAAPPGSLRSTVQHALRVPWRWTFEGCELHRDTATAIRRAGFADVAIVERRPRGSIFYPVNTMICGVARR